MNSAATFRGAIDAAVAYRDEYLKTWQENVNFRVMKVFASDDATQDRVSLPEDWARTRAKTSQLSFQLPKIVAKAKQPAFEGSAPLVTAAINEVLARECRAAYMIDECLADVINAAGLMVSVVGVDQRTETTEIDVDGPPLLDPTGAPILNPVDGTPLRGEATKKKVTRPLSQRFYWRRISPAAFLWPVEFTGSDWDQAPWLGYETWISLPEARRRFGSKVPADLKGTEKPPDLLSKDVRGKQQEDTGTPYVKLQVVWYRASIYDATKAHPDCLRRVTFIDGVPDPVEDGDTDWQVWIPEQPATPPTPGPDGQVVPGKPAVRGHYLGITTFPIRVGTLTYVSDLATPPSDSQAGRPQVREMMKSRSQMLRQRDHSVPVRWFDTNRLDEEVAESLRKGEWQTMVPVNGPGDRVIGEVARASYPRETFQFQGIIGGDLDRSWALSNNQLSAVNTGERSAAEVNEVSASNDIRLDYEKGRVNRYIAEGAAVLFSLMQRFLDEPLYVELVGPDAVARLQPVTQSNIAGDFLFEFKADSSDRVSTSTKIASALKLYNIAANSNSINRDALEKEIVELHGYDPAKLISPPKEKGPDPPNISYRFSGEDMLNPIVVALMIKAGHDLGQKDIEAAQMLIRDAVAGLRDISPQMTPSGPGPAPAPAGPPKAQPDVLPPDTNSPILKRTDNGDRLV